MSIREEGSNFPRVLGFKNRPLTVIRGQALRFPTRVRLADQAMALVRGETPVHLAQKLRGQRMIGGNLRQSLRNRIAIRQRSSPLRQQRYGYFDFPNVPKPYERPGTWSPTSRTAQLPSVTGILEGPERTVHPQRKVSVHPFS